MMQKVGNPSLKPKPKPKIEACSLSQLVTTRVPGHHRPHDAKQLKCQSLQCGVVVRRELVLMARSALSHFKLRQSSAASILGESGEPLGKAQITPVSAAIGVRARRCD
jgi:hypothetical protein